MTIESHLAASARSWAQEIQRVRGVERARLLVRLARKAVYVGALQALRLVLFNPAGLWLWVQLLKGRVEFFGTSHTIGDMVTETEYYLKRKRRLRSRALSVFLVNKPFIANPYLGRFLAKALGSRRVLFVMNRFLCRLLGPIEWQLFYAWDLAPQSKRRRGLRVGEVYTTQHPPEYHELNRLYQFHLERELSVAERRRARAALETLGLPRDATFVCVHAREAGFKAWAQPDGHGTFRNVDIETYLPAIEYLVRQGFFVVRMGEPAVKPLPPMARVIDYARSPLKSDWLDVVLMAECEFLLGCNSGFSHLAHLFNKKALWTNSIALETAPWDDLVLWMPKLIFSRAEGRHLTYPEIVERGYGSFQLTQQYEAANLELRDNSPEDILEAAKELHRWVLGEAGCTDEDRRRQAAFLRMFPPHYIGYGTRSNVCASFIRAHPDLMPQSAEGVAAVGAGPTS